MEKTITFIGLDVHKKSLSVAVADGGVGGEVRFAGTISNTAGALTKLADRLARKGGVLSFCYEAGPCGYGVYRHLPGTDGACGSGFGKKAAHRTTLRFAWDCPDIALKPPGLWPPRSGRV